ncbi:MAG: hypothetical protein JKY61_13070 [Planctomycetes bacterium]|nr:hypothetical protein [Planctomycetota bacterium]
MKQTLVTLHEAIELAIKTGEPVPLELDADVGHTLLDNLAFSLGHSFSWVVLPGGGWRLDGAGEQGAFTLTLIEHS